MDLELYRLKSEYGTIIKVPIPFQNLETDEPPEVIDFYFRRLNLGEWLALRDNGGNTKFLRSTIEKLLLPYGPDSEQHKIRLFEELVKRTSLARSIIIPIEQESEFDDDVKIESYYAKSLELAYSNAVLVVQLIMKAFPSYTIKDILSMNAEELLQTAAWAEVYLEKPFFTEYTFFNDKYKQMYRKEFLNNSEEDFEYSYENHMALKHFILNGEKEVPKRDELFTDENGVVRRGDPEEYKIRKAYYRENMQRRRGNMPPLTLAEYYSKIQSEGIDPTDPNIPQNRQNHEGDLTAEAAMSSSIHLQKRLEQEKMMRMQGKKPSRSFNWEEDRKSDLHWDK